MEEADGVLQVAARAAARILGREACPTAAAPPNTPSIGRSHC